MTNLKTYDQLLEPSGNEWHVYRKKTTIEAIRVDSRDDVPFAARPVEERTGRPLSFWSNKGFRIRTREGLTDWLPWGYFLATDGQSHWPIAPDFMEANYERV